MDNATIEVRGAREHNLKNVSITLPRNQLIVFTGVSGSGKSSMAFDTLYAEGQRRYLESLSSYARQFIGQLPKPNVDYIGGLSPAISISQKSTSSNPRSTVGTVTEIYDFLRVLYARVATGFCSKCDIPIASQTCDQIVVRLQDLRDADEYLMLAPVVRGQKGEYRELFESLQRQGYARARIDGQVARISDAPQLQRQQKHHIEVVVARFNPRETARGKIAEAVTESLKLGENTLIVIPWNEADADSPSFDEANAADDEQDEAPAAPKSRRGRTRAAKQTGELVMSSEYACPQCGLSSMPPTPQLLSFNSPSGMCGVCEGLGRQFTFSPELIVPDPTRSLRRGAIELLGGWNDLGRWQRHQLMSVGESIENEFGMQAGESLTMPWGELPAEVKQEWLYGTGERHITFTWRGGAKPMKYGGSFEGLVPQLLELYRNAKSPTARKRFEKYMERRHCDACGGSRLNPQARQLRLRSTATPRSAVGLRSPAKRKKGDEWLNLPDLCRLPIDECLEFLHAVQLGEIEKRIAAEALREIRNRLQFLLNVGLDYLSLERSAPTLSGGESQRIRLASQIGSGLVGVLYVLDEPSIGLHPRDNDRLIDSLKALRDQGNTLLVVEHDEDTMRAADLVLDFGPGPGVRGGEIVSFGDLNTLACNDKSLTGQFLTGKLSIPVPEIRRPGNDKAIRVRGATHNNLKDIDVDIPLGKLVCVTGVSGSGKSSLINDIVVPVLRRQLHAAEDVPGEHRSIEGIEHLDKVIAIDQSPIGRTPRSNPATYVKVFDEIRSLYVELTEAKRRGYQAGRFSFNVAGGRCESCEGNGSNRLEMDFLADLWVTCPICDGKRYNHETLQVKFKDKSIADVLDMDIQQALELFENVPKISDKLRTLHDVGLDYIKLGQPSPTLSGGEAQRIKLAKELSRRSTGSTLYLLDEPTTGLHFHDIRLLLKVLQDLVGLGNTVLVIEHNLDVIRAADWLIDIGAEGGEAGGDVVFEGTPDEIVNCRQSYTGRSLAKHIAAGPIQADKSSAKRSRASKRPASIPTPVLRVQGAVEHNLKDVSLEIPHHAMSVFCGPSGSGKSSMAMDTIYAEGQRRYVESLSSYARQFVGQMPKPRVERIEGLAPAIAIEQKSVAHNPRSTVGTVTEIYDYLRVLMARLGEPHCPNCDAPVSNQTADDITNHLLDFEEGTRLVLTAPLVWQPSHDPDNLWQDLRTSGLVRVRVNGRTHSLDEVPPLSSTVSYDLEAVIDRITIHQANRSRIAESVELALSLGNGNMFALEPRDDQDEIHWTSTRHSQHLACRSCGHSLQMLTPQSFSFNSPLGWCADCEGLGTQTGTSPALLLEPRLTIRQGAIRMWPALDEASQAAMPVTELSAPMLLAFCKAVGISLDVPIERLTVGQRRKLLYGTSEQWIELETEKGARFEFQWKGLFPALEFAARLSPTLRSKLNPFVAEVACSACDGSRLNQDAGAVKFRGLTIGDYTQGTMKWFHEQVTGWKLSQREQEIAGELVRELIARSEFLLDVGLEYLSLSRPANTLSGGESQRIRLSSQLGSGLCGVLYVLDEPTIGLHPRDNLRLIGALKKLRDLGNTLLVVEHDRDVIESSDQICDFGPAAGRFGGELVAHGTPRQLMRDKGSVTGPFLNDKLTIPVPARRRSEDMGTIRLRGARCHNLRDINIDLPLRRLTVVTGPSGSGKSTLINDVLYPAMSKRLSKQSTKKIPFQSIDGIDLIDKVIRVDQSPIGSNPSSTPATYTGVFDLIRQLYSQLPNARAAGYTPRQFSFNVPGGRCEKCEGAGQLRIEMHFLPDVWVECDSCHGRRFTEDVLSIDYHGFSIHDVLEMQIGQAVEVFSNIPKIRRTLQTLVDVGLDYISLGQSAPTLSGGEAQRVKLAAELSRPDTGKTLYLLDEPTTGLHFGDIIKLLEVLQRLVDLGNTVLVIEHNLDVIKAADWVLDLGPEAGSAGGQLVFAGTPEGLVEHAEQTRPGALASSSSAKNGKPASGSTSRKKKSAGTQVVDASDVSGAPEKLRSYTGEALIPLMRTAEYIEREAYDHRAAAKGQEGDLDLEQIGRDTLLPWQADGQRWHTKDSVDRAGGQIRWERDILVKVIEALETVDGFAPTNWDNRSIVEVAGPVKSRGWFLHAITAETWLLKLKFRVPRRSFTKAQMLAIVELPTLNQMQEVEMYGNEPRVTARATGAWMELEIRPHTLAEIDSPKFWRWLRDASSAFLGKTTPTPETVESSDPKQHAPWRVLKQRWHSLRKGFPPGRTVVWPAETLSVFIQSVHQAAGGGKWRWDEQTTARYFLPGNSQPWIVLHTKRPEGLIAVLHGPSGYDPGDLKDTLPVKLQMTSRGSDEQQLQMAFTELQQPRDSAVKKLLTKHMQYVSRVKVK
ncbi:MAG: excinuclease ABC subunit UvrA [Pirellulaceae bacterium]|nr:excinuclease ABC subunit UvrA [Pirellulaceae bacterium]